MVISLYEGGKMNSVEKVNYKNKNVSYESLIQWKAYDLAKEVTYI